MKLKFVNNQNLLLTVTLIIFTVLLLGNSSSKNTDDFFDPADDSLSYVSLATSISENSSFIRARVFRRECCRNSSNTWVSIFYCSFFIWKFKKYYFYSKYFTCDLSISII